MTRDREQVIQQAIEEWAAIAGGPQKSESPTLAHYIDACLEEDLMARSCLVPLSSWSRKWNEDGSLRCNHSDAAGCTETDHTTVILYEIVDDQR